MTFAPFAAVALAVAAFTGPAAFANPAAFAQAALVENACHAVTRQGGRPLPLIGVSVLRRAAAPGDFVPPRMPSDVELAALLCFRSSAVPGPDDYKVVMAGYPLYLSSTRESGDVITTLLDIDDAQFRVRVIDGALTPAEHAEATRRLEAYYAAVNDGY